MTLTGINEMKRSVANSAVTKNRENLSLRKVCKVSSRYVSSTTVNNSKTEIPTPVTRQTKVRQFHNNCILPETPLSCKKPSTRPQGKSLSLVELSLSPKPLKMKKWLSKEHVDKLTMPVVEHDYFALCPGRERQLAEKVCKALVLLAWRRARAQCETMRKTEKTLETQVQSLNLQVLVLKDLLESEKSRTNIAVENALHLKNQLEKKAKTISDLQQTVHGMETEQLKCERTQCELSEEISSLTQTLDTKKQVIKNLTDKCSQFETYLSEYKDKESQILKELEANKCELTDKINSIKLLKQKCSENEVKVNRLTDLNLQLTTSIEFQEKRFHENITEIKKIEGELNNWKNMNKAQNQNITDLRMEVAQGKYQIKEYENNINNLKQTIIHLDNEKHGFRQNVSSVMLKVGGTILKLLPSPHL